MPKNRRYHKPKEFKPGDLLTKTDVCDLFCERLRIGKSTYYEKIYPMLKFQPVEQPIAGTWKTRQGAERMPYTIANGILNKLTGYVQKSDPPQYELNKYLK